MKVRCSSLGKIMTKSRSKDQPLSKTAQSYIKEIAKQDFYGYEATLDNKYLDKGRTVEDEAIQLYNDVFFTMFQKHEGRVENDYLTGECDVLSVDLDKIIDIKSSWSLETFPALPEDINNNEYEWQLRGYMMLYGAMSAELAYCMVSTPDDLLKDWESDAIHKVDHIDPCQRVTVVEFQRDLQKEEEIKTQCKLAQEYYNDYIAELNNKNK